MFVCPHLGGGGGGGQVSEPTGGGGFQPGGGVRSVSRLGGGLGPAGRGGSGPAGGGGGQVSEPTGGGAVPAGGGGAGSASCALLRAVCLLRSRRRSFLFQSVYTRGGGG